MIYSAIIVGTSAGGLEACKCLLNQVKKITRPIIIIQHLSPSHESYLPVILGQGGFEVYEINDKMKIENKIYVAPPNYHVLIEKEGYFTLTVEDRVSFARPSIDVAFETAADAYKSQLVGILLTGANHDGANGLKVIKDLGGMTMVQSPQEAYADEMPLSALRIMEPDYVLPLEEIRLKINEILEI